MPRQAQAAGVLSIKPACRGDLYKVLRICAYTHKIMYLLDGAGSVQRWDSSSGVRSREGGDTKLVVGMGDCALAFGAGAAQQKGRDREDSGTRSTRERRRGREGRKMMRTLKRILISARAM